ncbi:unannotated protein [freshwater metagenome]|uniref:Unannotated protein n=1 Tax=freshwater metagenome TaxID=449393 RepID=A0A6J6X0W2_9ZZZZ
MLDASGTVAVTSVAMLTVSPGENHPPRFGVVIATPIGAVLITIGWYGRFLSSTEWSGSCDNCFSARSLMPSRSESC